MSDTYIITEIAIALRATLILLLFGIKYWHIHQSVKNIPMRYQEWLAQYKTKRGYILIAQLIGIIIAIFG